MRKTFSILIVLFLMSAIALPSLFGDVKLLSTKATRDIVIRENAKENTDELSELKVQELYKMDFPSTLVSNKTAESDVFAIDEDIQLTFTSQKDCYLTVLDFTPSGKIIVLFPNEWQKDNAVKANEPVKIPHEKSNYQMKAGGPPGTDVVKAVATIQKEEIVDRDTQQLAGPFALLDVKGKKAVTREILLVAKDPDLPLEPTPPADTNVPTPSPDDTTAIATPTAPVGSIEMSVPSLSVHTKGTSPEQGAFGAVVKGDWIVKAWLDKDEFKAGDLMVMGFQTNQECKLVSLINKGTSAQENKLLPEGATPSLKPEAISMIPAGNEKWIFKIEGPSGNDTIVAQLKNLKEETSEITLTLKVTE